MTIYTKTGDDGTTGIFTKKGGKSVRFSKSDPLIEAIGSVDEVNSYIGIIDSKLKTQSSKVKTKTSSYVKTSEGKQKLKLEKKLQEIQRDLFTVGAGLAEYTGNRNIGIQGIGKRITKMEREIDEMEAKLPKLTGFILPGGSEVSAYIMYARALVRRAERKIVYDLKLKVQNSPNNKYTGQAKLQLKTQNFMLKYMNRLSDYLFVLARWANWKEGVGEEKWNRKLLFDKIVDSSVKIGTSTPELVKQGRKFE